MVCATWPTTISPGLAIPLSRPWDTTRTSTTEWPGAISAKRWQNFYRWFTELTFSTAEDYARTRLFCALQATERRGTWLVLGLRQYREAHGQWPESLDAIAAYVPAEALEDPINDSPFVYVRQGDDFQLYSKGPDGIDESAVAGSPSSITT